MDELWPYTGEMFEADDGEPALIAQGVADRSARACARPGRETVAAVLAEATLTAPADGWMQRGGRDGRHSEHLGHLLAELQILQRTYPGATW